MTTPNTTPNTTPAASKLTTKRLNDLNPEKGRINNQILGVMSACSYSHVFYATYLYERQRVNSLSPQNPLSLLIPTAATDGTNHYYNEEWCATLTPAEAVGVMCHEIAHDFYGHHAQSKTFRQRGQVPKPGGGFLPFDDHLANVAQDAVINFGILKSGMTLPKARIEFDYVDETMTWLDVYAREFEQPSQSNKPKPHPGEGEGEGDEPDHGHGGFDIHVEPTKDETESDQRSREQALQSALAAGEKAGKVPQNMKRYIDSLLDATVPWTTVLADLVVRVAGIDSLDWNRLNRRHLLALGTVIPRRKAEHCPPIALCVDVSGSTAAFIPQFLNEVGAIATDLSPKAIHVIWCDTRVAGVDTLDDAEAADVAALTIKGGGGTNLVAAFDYIERDEDGIFGEIAALVILSDSETPWPSQTPPYPVICATTNTDLPHPEWMQVVQVTA